MRALQKLTRPIRTSTHMQVFARRLCESWGKEAKACCHDFALHAMSLQPHHIASLVLLSLILASGAALCSQGCNVDIVTLAFLVWCFCPLLLLTCAGRQPCKCESTTGFRRRAKSAVTSTHQQWTGGAGSTGG